MCFAPILLIGYLFTLQPNASHVTNLDNPYVQVQTCDRGPGLDLKATPDMGVLQAQYGFVVHEEGPWTVSILPKAGGAMLSKHIPESQSQMNFALSIQLLVGYERIHFSLEQLHESNAGLGQRNAGFDGALVGAGFRF